MSIYDDLLPKKDKNGKIIQPAVQATPTPQNSALNIYADLVPKEKSQAPAAQPTPLDNFVTKAKAIGQSVIDSITHKSFSTTPTPKVNIDTGQIDRSVQLDLASPGTSMPSAQRPNTPQLRSQQTQSVGTSNAIGSKFADLLPQATQQFQQVNLDPANLKADPRKAISDIWNGLKEPLQQEGQNIAMAFRANTPAKVTGAYAKVVSGGANVIFSPITALFSAANDIPVLGTLTKAMTVPITALGEGGTKISNTLIDKIPNSIISQKSKDIIKPGLGEIAALVAQFGVAKLADLPREKINALEQKYGVRDAKTIIEQAQKVAQETENKNITRAVLSPEHIQEQLARPDLANTPAAATLQHFADQAKATGRHVEIGLNPKPSDGVVTEMGPNGKPFSVKLVAPETPALDTFNKNIKDYQSNGGFSLGKQTEDAALRDIGKVVDHPDVVAETKARVQDAIKTNKITPNTDGTITLYRGGEPSPVNGLTSYTYDKSIAQGFVDAGKQQGQDVPLTEIKVKPEDIKAFIGKAEGEVLLKNPNVDVSKVSNTDQVPVSKVSEPLKAPKNTEQKVLTGNQVNAIRDTIQSKLQHIRETASGPEDVTKGIDELVNFAVDKAGNDKQVLSALRTELNKEMFSFAGGGNYKEQYKTLKTLQSESPEMGKIIDNLESHVANLDKQLLTAKTPTPTEKQNLTPIGEGEIKTSTLATGVEEKAVEAKLIKSMSSLPEYKTLNMKEQGKDAVKFLNDNPEKAIRVALGQDVPPAHVTPEAVFTAVENRALQDGNVELIRKLARSQLTTEATAMGQRIRTLAERNPDSPVSVMKDLIKERKIAVEKKTGKSIATATTETVKEIKAKVPKVDRYDWSAFIKSIEC